MKLTLQIQLLPSIAQKRMLLETMEKFNAAATHAAKVGFDAGVFSHPSIQSRCYRYLREKFGLSSQMAVRAIGKASVCFSGDKKHCPVFKPLGAMTYDERLMSFKGVDKVSLLTLGGRQIIPMIYGEYQKERFDRIKGQCDLVYRGNKFYLMAGIDLPDKAPIEVKEFIGVDMGVEKIVTTSDGQCVSGSHVEAVRQKYFKIRKSLGHKMHHRHKRRTRKNARRVFRRIGNKEARFKRHQNHVISKALVVHAKDTGRGIAIEDLNGIRDRARFQRKQRAKMGGWAFHQLREFLTYKGELYGVPIAVVDPRDTSRTCAKCGHCEKGNRKNQSEFVCLSCGHTDNADLNAAINIAARAVVIPPKVSENLRTVAA